MQLGIFAKPFPGSDPRTVLGAVAGWNARSLRADPGLNEGT